jgi:hypothetical protein
MTIEMAIIELVCIAEKAVITGSRAALMPTRHIIAGHIVEFAEAECSPPVLERRSVPLSAAPKTSMPPSLKIASRQPSSGAFSPWVRPKLDPRRSADTRYPLWLIDGYSDAPVAMMLIDRAVFAHQVFTRVTGWVGYLVIRVEREFFGRDGPSAHFRDRYGQEGRAIRGRTSLICEKD